MWKNYMLAAINVMISSLPIWVTWSPIVGTYYCGGAVLFLLLFSWNTFGTFIVVHFAFRAKSLPQDAVIAPVLNQYLQTVIGKGFMEERGSAIYYTGSKIPYYIPVNKWNIVISLALEERLRRYGANLLFQRVPESMYDIKLMISRNVLLLSLISYTIVIRFMELWAIIFAVTVKLFFSLVMLIVTGALLGNVREMADAISLGSLIGTVALKINDIANYIQDKIIEVAMKWVFTYSFQFVEESGCC